MTVSGMAQFKIPTSMNQLKKSSIDWRSTALSNFGMDLYQTIRFKEDGYVENNKLFAGFVNNNKSWVVGVGSFGAALVFDSFVRSQPKKEQDYWYAGWAILHVVAVERNRQKFGYGFPLVTFKW